METLEHPLPFEEFENIYPDIYDPVEVCEEAFVNNPNVSANEIYNEEYVMNDDDHKDFDHENLDNMSLSDLVIFPEDLKDFGIDISSNKINSASSLDMFPFTCSPLKIIDEVEIEDTDSSLDLSDPYFLNEVEIKEENVVIEEEICYRSTDTSESDIVDVGSPNDILSVLSTNQEVRPVVYAQHKKFIASKAFGMVCPPKKKVHKKNQSSDSKNKGIGETKRELSNYTNDINKRKTNKDRKEGSRLRSHTNKNALSKIGGGIKKDGNKSKNINLKTGEGNKKDGNKSKNINFKTGEENKNEKCKNVGKGGEELDKKLQETVEMLLDRKKKKDMEWQRAMKQKTHNALQAFQTSQSTDSHPTGVANLQGNSLVKKCGEVNVRGSNGDDNDERSVSERKGIVESPDHNYAKGGVVQNNQVDASKRSTVSKNLEAYLESHFPKKGSFISDSNQLIGNKKCKTIKSAGGNASPKKMTSILNLSKFNSNTKSCEPLKRCYSAVNDVNEACKGTSPLPCHADNKLQKVTNKEHRIKSILCKQITKAASSNNLLSYKEHKLLKNNILQNNLKVSNEIRTNKREEKIVNSAGKAKSCPMWTCGNLSPQNTFNFFTNSALKYTSVDSAKVMKKVKMVAFEEGNKACNYNSINFFVEESCMDEDVVENVVVSCECTDATSIHNREDSSQNSPIYSNSDDMNLNNSNTYNVSDYSMKKNKKKISLSDYRKMSRSKSFTVEKATRQRHNIYFDYTITADHNYFCTSVKECDDENDKYIQEEITSNNKELNGSKVKDSIKGKRKNEGDDPLQHKLSRNLTDSDMLRSMNDFPDYDNTYPSSTILPASSQHTLSASSSRSSSRSSSSCSSSRSSPSFWSLSSRSQSRSTSRSSSGSSYRSHSRSRPHYRSRSRYYSRSYSRSRSRSRLNSRCSSRSPYDACSSDSDYSGSSPRSDFSWESRRKRGEVSINARISNNGALKETARKMEAAGHERRIIYVGCLRENTSRHDLEMLLKCFGNIIDSSVHSKPSGDHYGFVTYEKSPNAARCKQDGNRVPGCENFDFGYGGRRHFCGSGYNDLDKDIAIYRQQQKQQHQHTVNIKSMNLDELLAYHADIKRINRRTAHN